VGNTGAEGRLMVLVEANKVVLLCHGIQIILSQDTDHGGRLGILDQQRHLDRMIDFSSMII